MNQGTRCTELDQPVSLSLLVALSPLALRNPFSPTAENAASPISPAWDASNDNDVSRFSGVQLAFASLPPKHLTLKRISPRCDV